MNPGLYLTDTSVVKIIEVSEKESYGYDLSTEELSKYLNSDLTPMPAGALKLLNDERVKYLVSKEFANTKLQMATILGVTPRTIHRICKEYELTLNSNQHYD